MNTTNINIWFGVMLVAALIGFGLIFGLFNTIIVVALALSMLYPIMWVVRWSEEP